MEKYNRKLLDETYNSLNDKQKIFLNEYIIRGKKTQWLNAWAKKKGEVLTEESLENVDEAMEKLLEWILVDFEDNFKVNSECRCECGRPLRYRYTVRHKSTGKIYKLGSVHFEQHTGLAPETVMLIAKGLQKIDLERDEILDKVSANWNLPIDLPDGFQLPKDILEQLKVGLPLLDRQVQKLRKLVSEKRRGRSSYKRKAVSSNKNIKLEMNYDKLPDLPDDKHEFSEAEFPELMRKLKNVSINAAEAKELFYMVKGNQDRLSLYGLSLQDVKKVAIRALGKIGSNNIRTWLVEIDYIIENK